MVLRFTLMGGCVVCDEQDHRIEFPTRKARALLAYLACTPGLPRSRDDLADLLWNRSAEEQARGSLRQTLARIRKCLGDAYSDLLISDADTLCLDAAGIDADVLRLERLARSDSQDSLEEAATLYRGQFLSGFELNEPPFEEWAFSERRRLGELVLTALTRLLAVQQAEGAVDKAISTANKLLTIDPLQEDVHQTLMRLLARQGRIESALSQYKSCRRILEMELDIAPSQETESLYREIMDTRDGEARRQWADSSADHDPAAVLRADLYGFGLLMGEHSRRRPTAMHLLEDEVKRFGGEVIATPASGLVARLKNPSECIACAIDALEQMGRQNAELPRGERVLLRIGVAADNRDVETAISRASRYARFADPGGIYMGREIRERSADEHVADAVPLEGDSPSEGPEAYRIPPAHESAPDAISASAPRQLRHLDIPVPDKPSIAILPFRNLSEDPDHAFLGEGLRIDIQNALVKISGLFLIAAGSANAYREEDPVEAGRHFGVGHVLHGDVRRVGDRARIDIQLANTTSGAIEWADQFDRTLDDTFSVQDEITQQVVTALDVQLVSGEQAKVWHKTLKDLKVLETFYRGVHDFFQMEPAAMANARQRFEAVHEMCSDVSIGSTWAAFSHWFEAFRRWSDDPELSFARAGEWAGMAIEMDDADGQAHTVMGHVHLLNRKFDEALDVGRQAVSIRPNCTNANGFYANILHYCGDQAGAIKHIKRAMRFSPVYPPFFAGILASAYRANGQIAAAIPVAQEAISLNPDDIYARLALAASYSAEGWRSGARDVAEEILRIDPEFSVRRFANDQPYRDKETLEHYIEELRDAGLPD